MLQIKNLNLTHKKDLRVILSEFNLVLNKGDKAVIIGEEGNGKSTLMKWIYNPWFVDNVKKYHRTFSTIINTLINSGFSIERMIEPLPTDEILEQYPDYKDLFHKPDFLLLRVKK